jgi:hypothetical protein
MLQFRKSLFRLPLSAWFFLLPLCPPLDLPTHTHTHTRHRSKVVGTPVSHSENKVKVKAIPLQARCGPEGSRRMPDFMTFVT